MSRVTDVSKKVVLLGVFFALVMLGRHLGISCILFYLTSIPCPGCGMTRACLAALRLDFQAAFAYHAMFWSVPLLLGYFFCDGNLFGRKKLDGGVLIAIGVVFLIQWIIKLCEAYI